ncbi:hypothetical protein QQ045_023144 [Rhodiola kirilowii]
MCVSPPSFLVLIDGEMVDYFEGKRGLQQGDPLSTFLFLIAMEYLSRLLANLDRKAGFYYHPKCHRIYLKHFLFVDDLFLFSSGRPLSIIALKVTVERFLRSSGLSINLAKSQVFVAGIPDNKKASKSLSVFYFWARMCILPRKILHTVNTLRARFLWKRNATCKGSFLVSWKEELVSLMASGKNKLLTRDRLRDSGFMVENSCVLYGRAPESRDHLFFECQFFKEVLEVSTKFLKVHGIPTIWHLMIPWFKVMKANALRTRMLAAAISMIAYEI